ncbi:MAG: asparagine--tRNA ligase [Sphingobacteriaceae bacterium]|nr:asparagine--tRNA ligase [Sphingobacteriaceae bacterium]
MTIDRLKEVVGNSTSLRGWVMGKRTGKGLVFLIVRDGSGMCQCIVDETKVSAQTFEDAKRITQESSLRINGTVVADERQVGGYELHVTGLEIIGESVDYPITPKEHGVDFLMDHRHLWLRSKRQWAILRIRNTIIMAIHEFFQGEGFIQTDAPIFTGNAVEGTSTLFETDFYGEPAYLSQSGQLYGEAMAMAFGKIYTFGPTFRAEKSKTRRHLSEFWMIEPEMAFHDLSMNMDVIERFLRHVVLHVLAKNQMELEMIGRDTAVLRQVTETFPRIPYEDAVAILKGEKEVNGQNAVKTLEADMESAKSRLEAVLADIADREAKLKTPGMKKGEIGFHQAKVQQLKEEQAELEETLRNIPLWLKSAREFRMGNDFGGSDETVITRLFNTPIMVYNWPHEVKAFYMKRDENDPRWAKGVDVLAPEGYGEIVGGGERETNFDWLVEKINEHQLPMEAFEWYLDLRRYGSVPHSGFGLGLERLVAWVCKLPHVRETIPFPRMYGRIAP